MGVFALSPIRNITLIKHLHIEEERQKREHILFPFWWEQLAN